MSAARHPCARGYTSALLALASLGPAAGCDTEEIWVEPTPGLHRMQVQPRADPYEATRAFRDGKVMQDPPRGAVSRAGSAELGQVRSRALFLEHTERNPDGLPFPLNEATLTAGQERYGVFCAVCHGVAGYSATYVATRMSLVRPPSLHTDRLRQMPARYFYDVITQGYGMMPSYANEIGERERWAIAAYVQALQLSQHIAMDELPEELRRRVRGATGSAATGGGTR